jgi:hypothetical protein
MAFNPDNSLDFDIQNLRNQINQISLPHEDDRRDFKIDTIDFGDDIGAEGNKDFHDISLSH